jgi:hypothetical protein
LLSFWLWCKVTWTFNMWGPGKSVSHSKHLTQFGELSNWSYLDSDFITTGSMWLVLAGISPRSLGLAVWGQLWFSNCSSKLGKKSWNWFEPESNWFELDSDELIWLFARFEWRFRDFLFSGLSAWTSLKTQILKDWQSNFKNLTIGQR